MNQLTPGIPCAGSQIIGTGSFQPARVLTNNELSLIVETSDEWIRERVGIQERRIADTETVADLALGAATEALLDARIDAAELDLIVVATVTAKDRSPNIAGRVSASLGAASPAVIDINVACSGFTHAMAVADHAIRAGSAKTAMVIGAEKLSDFTDWSDRSTCVLVGDGAGAVILTATEEPEVGPVCWGSIPALAHAVRIEEPSLFFEQEGLSIYRWAITRAAELARRTCEMAGITPERLAGFIPHQANLRIIEPLARQLGISPDITARDIVNSGNTSSASIPIALAKLLRTGDVAPGSPLLLFGFGGGFSYAGQVVLSPRTAASEAGAEAPPLF